MRPTSTVGRADDRLVTAIRAELDVQTHTSTGTRGRLMRRVVARLETEHGPGVVPVPARTTFYELVNQLATGRHSFGTATTRRSLANRPARAFTPTFALRPGEIIQIDSTPLDVMAVLDDGVLGRPELTAVVDVATRTIAAAVLRPEGTKAIDASLLLARMLVPQPMGARLVRRAADVRLGDPARPAPGHRHPPAAGRGQARHRPGDHRHRPRQGLRLGGVHPRLRVPGHQPAARPPGRTLRPTRRSWNAPSPRSTPCSASTSPATPVVTSPAAAAASSTKLPGACCNSRTFWTSGSSLAGSRARMTGCTTRTPRPGHCPRTRPTPPRSPRPATCR